MAASFAAFAGVSSATRPYPGGRLPLRAPAGQGRKAVAGRGAWVGRSMQLVQQRGKSAASGTCQRIAFAAARMRERASRKACRPWRAGTHRGARRRSGAPQKRSPTSAWPMCAMWTRIWWVRPVSTTSTRVARGKRSVTRVMRDRRTAVADDCRAPRVRCVQGDAPIGTEQCRRPSARPAPARGSGARPCAPGADARARSARPASRPPPRSAAGASCRAGATDPARGRPASAGLR